MKPLSIDFAPARRQRLGATALGVTLLVSGLVVASGALWHASDWQRHSQRLQARLAAEKIKDTAFAQAHRAPSVSLSTPQITAINDAVRHLNLPWRDLFDAVETATPPEIALLALDPDPEHQLLRLTAEAATSEAMLDYVVNLKQQTVFSAISMKRHQLDAVDPNNVLRFSVTLSLAERR
ncbi:hypothetical protein [Collimonas fungivorans]|uniref:hypothetical protein n=1 Tax=Collimonas fungivorans TaxID=158899 RepID=UPI0007784698|nr:hypothetical protein [Collimonas fungivorans]